MELNLAGQKNSFLFVGMSKKREDFFLRDFISDNENTFTEILFFGEENSLFIWNTITYLFVDSLSSNYVLAAIITYLLNFVSHSVL